MSEQEQVPSNVESPVSLAVNSGSETIGANLGNITNNALNSVFRFLKTQYGKALVLNKSVYIKYLQNAYERYNKIKTLATGNEPRNIIGENNIYVQINVKNKARNKEVDTSTIEPLLNVSKNLIIRGTGGAGKSMLFRYLFLNTINNGKYIPIFLKLRKITNKDTNINGILNLIYNCMNDLDVTLDREQFEYSLRLGKYVFFLDGFDGIKSELVAQTAESIQKFASKYPQNSYIISSRPDRKFYSFETFTILDCMNLSKKQAIELSKKLGEDSETTKVFCKQLDTHLFYKHKDFASNPLLLSMMFLTFMHNNFLPGYRTTDFYEKCYQALYSKHDMQNKGSHKREFQCANLDECSFRKLFSKFCFKTYFKDKYEFTEEELISEMQWCIEKLGLKSKVSAKQYIDDLCEIVCLIIKEGNTYRFAHRSFQTYFAAVYTETLSDDKQKTLFSKLLSDIIIYFEDYFELLAQIEPERFLLNAPLDGLNEIQSICENYENPALYFLKMAFSAVIISKTQKYISVNIEPDDKQQVNFYNLYTIFKKTFFQRYSPLDYAKPKGKLLEIIKKAPGNYWYYFSELDHCDWLNDEERNILYDYLIRNRLINEILNKMCEYNKKMIDSVKKEEENFFDAF